MPKPAQSILSAPGSNFGLGRVQPTREQGLSQLSLLADLSPIGDFKAMGEGLLNQDPLGFGLGAASLLLPGTINVFRGQKYNPVGTFTDDVAYVTPSNKYADFYASTETGVPGGKLKYPSANASVEQTRKVDSTIKSLNDDMGRIADYRDTLISKSERLSSLSTGGNIDMVSEWADRGLIKLTDQESKIINEVKNLNKAIDNKYKKMWKMNNDRMKMIEQGGYIEMYSMDIKKPYIVKNEMEIFNGVSPERRKKLLEQGYDAIVWDPSGELKVGASASETEKILSKWSGLTYGPEILALDPIKSLK